jgi:hypothetical protein
MDKIQSNGQYEILKPWADVDPVPLKGISVRLTGLSGKKIGIFRNFKPAAEAIANIIEKTFKERFPIAEISWYHSNGPNVLETETENKEAFEDWVKGIDAAITLVGD